MTTHAPQTIDDSSEKTGRTLDGHRLCATCLHPMAGSPIERHCSSNILFARCTECGAPSPLIEYPTLTPWVTQLRGLAACAVLLLTLLAFIVQTLLAWSAMALAVYVPENEVFSRVLLEMNQASKAIAPNPLAEPAAWLLTPDGQAALTSSTDSSVYFAVLTLAGSGAFLIAMCSGMLAGVVCLRLRALPRMLIANLAHLVLAAMWCAICDLDREAPWSTVNSLDWSDLVQSNDSATRWILAFAALLLGGAVGGLLGPLMLRTLAKTVFPPRERELVSWIWTFGGMKVPK